MRFPVMLAVSAFVFLGAPVSAQTFGPPIPGMCLLSRPAAIGASRAGQSMQAQLKQMQASLSAQLAQQRAAIDQQRRALEARQNATAPIEYQRQLAALNQQALALDQQQNARFIAALSRIVTRSGCSVVFERDNAYGWNNAMDITEAVAQEMNGLLQAVSLN